MNNSRIKTLIFTFYFIFTVIIGRLFFLQVLQHDTLSRQVIEQTYKIIELKPQRGLILDSYHNPIAFNQTFYQASLYKPNSQDLNLTTSKLQSILPREDTEDNLLISNFIQNQNQKWITLNHLFSSDELSQIQDPGIIIEPVSQRSYSSPLEYQQITGFIGKNDDGDLIGYGGLEGYYQKILSGRFGFNYQNQDAVGKVVMSDRNWSSPAVNGSDLILSIDPAIQYQAYRILSSGIKKYDADSGSIVILKPSSGQIISLLSLEASPSADTPTRNRVISDIYEPGSIFKPLVMTSALDSNSISPNWICQKCSQPRTIGQYTITNWDNSVHPDSSLKDIIKNSDNIGMSYIMSNMGIDTFLKYFSNLGITHKTGIDLQGESRPPPKTSWPEIDIATASFGQGFALTQIQMATAFNTLANQGFLVRPHLVTGLKENYQLVQNKTDPPKPVFKPESVQLIKEILRYAVENSPVAQLKPKNMDVCAKSGTAQVAVKGSYSDSSVIASYIGFTPCDNPKFTMLVTLDHPKSSSWGSSTSAPIWFELAQTIYPLL